MPPAQATFHLQLFSICVVLARFIHGAPIPGVPTPLTVSTGLPTPSPSASSVDAQLSSQPWPSPITLTDPLISIPSSTATVTQDPASTVTSISTERLTITATQTAAPITVTSTILFTSTVIDELTATVTASPVSTESSPSTSSLVPASTPSSTSTRPSWTIPSDFSGNVSTALGAKRWSWGAGNVQLVESIPSTAWATSASPSENNAAVPASNLAAASPPVDLSNGPAMQVLFPKGSINPANKNAPTGGVGLYMSPLDLSQATNVSLEYSVFFPVDFDFVKGGKLPGMYGGHKGCSGGQESEDCFSTRLMFRSGGKGELYLYVPKGVQTEELCNTPPLSYCESTYGLSIGRGAWTFEKGAWSNIRQEIRLNTPGLADGGFRIFVNDKLVLSSDSVLFRAQLSTDSPVESPSSTPASPFSSLPTAVPNPTETSETLLPTSTTAVANEDEGLLGGLLGGLAGELGNVIKRSDIPTITEYVTAQSTQTVLATSTVIASPSQPPRDGRKLLDLGSVPALVNDLPLADSAAQILGADSILADKKKASSPKVDNAGFDGIMFNTFFGGSDPSWASPKDQNIWFNRISLSINA